MNKTMSYNQAIFILLIDNGGYDGTNIARALTKAQAAFRRGFGITDFDKQYDGEDVESDVIMATETKVWRL